jgi:hypothetical protein
MNILTIVNELRAEKAAGNEMFEQFISRIDAHIRDLETLKAWALDNKTARDMALGGMLGMEPEAPQMAPVVEVKDEAAA